MTRDDVEEQMERYEIEYALKPDSIWMHPHDITEVWGDRGILLFRDAAVRADPMVPRGAVHCSVTSRWSFT